MDKDFIDVDYQEVDNEIYLTAPQVAQRIKDTDIRVRFWADAFGDLIGIEKVNGRKRYKESDVDKFLFIKDLLDNKNFKHDQAKAYISKHGFKYAEFNSGLIDPKDPLGFQALASALTVEVNKQLNLFGEEILKSVKQELEDSLLKQHQLNLETKAEIEASVDEIVTDKLNTLDSKFQEITNYLDTKEMDAKARDNEMIDILRRGQEQKSEQSEQVEMKQGFLKKLFNKNK